MSPEERALGQVLDVLDRLAVPHMVTGSLVSSFYGRPRSTHDSDVVINPSVAQINALVDALTDAGFLVDRQAALAAFERKRQFNAIEIASAAKVDLIIKKNRPFSDAEFERRQVRTLLERRPVPVASLEDAVLSKLEWARAAGDSERQIADAAAIVALNPTLDRAYTAHWARALGVADIWERLSGQADDVDR